jgi:hypothetical protein
MNKFIISCDTTSDLPESIIKKVSVENMLYSIDGEEYGGNTWQRNGYQ